MGHGWILLENEACHGEFCPSFIAEEASIVRVHLFQCHVLPTTWFVWGKELHPSQSEKKDVPNSP